MSSKSGDRETYEEMRTTYEMGFLRPCPSCGCYAEFEVDDSRPGNAFIYIQCSCADPVDGMDFCGMRTYSVEPWAVAIAIRNWNRRVDDE